MQPIGGYGVKDLDRNLFVVGKEAVSIQLGRESGLVSRLVILDLSAGTLSSPRVEIGMPLSRGASLRQKSERSVSPRGGAPEPDSRLAPWASRFRP